MFKRYGLLAFLLILVLILAACGGKSASTQASGDAAAGEKLFKSTVLHDNPGCITCHSLNPGETLVGPSMAGIAPDAAGDAEEAGMTTEEMLKQMIVDPNAEIAGGFQPDVMPQDWGDKLTAQELNDIIAFLMTLK